MHETSAPGWCTGKTQRDRVEREVGGGIGMGNTCKSMADSRQRMAKTTTIKKKISFNTKHQQQSLKTSATKFEDIISTPFIISTKRRSRIKIIIWGIFRRKL